MATGHDIPIRRALLSVSDKAELVPFARALIARGVTIISTGGTATALAEAGVPVTPVEVVTGFPEGLDGRVKTLHPAIHAGLLARRDDPAHAAFLSRQGFEPIDLVCINLYPFQRTISAPGAALADAIENIDIGGPAMLRAAAKNYASVTVVTSPGQHDRVIGEMDARGGATTFDTRAELAAAAFARTAEYDAAIAGFLSRTSPDPFPQVLDLRYTKVDRLRYGENPHQAAALYLDPAGAGQTIVGARQLHGKQLSYNNILDAAWALEAVKSLAGSIADGRSAAVVVKHTNPCGGAVAGTLTRAVDRAIAGDPVAAYGGILSVSSAIDIAAAQVIADPKNFFEVVVAPEFEPGALDLLRSRWVGVRLLSVGPPTPLVGRLLEHRSIPGGVLVQERDVLGSNAAGWTHAAGPPPDKDDLSAAAVLDALCRFVSSNAVVVGGTEVDGHDTSVRLFGVGSGQVDRVSACRLAVAKSGVLARGAIAIGDAFFPFPDGSEVLIDAGVRMIVHPGGSKRDQETFDLCNSRQVTCMVTGVRHFRH